MKPYILMLPMSWYVYLHLFTLALMWFGPNRTVAVALGNQTDHLALLQFKQLISSDPYGILNSWNSSTHFCNWNGIICSPKHQRVTKLKLSGYKLHGSISPYIGNLSRLRFLNLENNNFNGNIPQELGRLSRLRYFLLSNNSLVGEFPLNLTNCSELKSVDLEGNKLFGKIPSQFGSLQKLHIFYIGTNNLSGKIPPSIRNLSSLNIFSIGYNNLVGNIPREICFLKQLKFIAVHANKLSGTFLSCLYNMSSLTGISVAANSFSGSLLPNMFNTLPNLYFYGIGGNQFSGPIPTSIANAYTLIRFDIGGNHFVGQVPCLGKLQKLWSLRLQDNKLGDMVAHVSDFGIARLVSVIEDTSHQETSTIGIKGTVGYAPPEYGMGSEVSTSGDMYSFGMLMLEMITGRRPTDEMFEDGQNLHMFVESSFEDNLIQILDPHLVSIEDGYNENLIPAKEKCLVSLLRIGLACSMESPKERMSIIDVTRELNIIRTVFVDGETN